MRTYVPHVLGPLHFIWWIKAKHKPSTHQKCCFINFNLKQSGFTKMAISWTSIQEVLIGSIKSVNRDSRKEEKDENLRQSRRWFHCLQNHGLAVLPEHYWGLMVLAKTIFNNLYWSPLGLNLKSLYSILINSYQLWRNSHSFNFTISFFFTSEQCRKANIKHRSQTHRPWAVESCRNQTRKVSWEK